MKKVLFLAMMATIMFCGCNSNKNGKTNENPYIDRLFVFQEVDSVENGFTYVKYIPTNQLKPESKVVTSKYVRYHNDDSTGIAFERDYIRRLCLGSRCVYREIQDTIYGYGLVREIYFPEAYLGFAYDEWEEMPVYSYIYFADDFWYSDITEDGITVTSDVETALWELLPYALDSVQANVDIYKYDEKSGISLDHTNVVYLMVWDIIKKFHNYPMYDGLKKDGFIVYTNESGLTFVKKNGCDTLKSVFFAGYTISNPESLKLLELCFMDKLKNIPIRDDGFIEPFK